MTSADSLKMAEAALAKYDGLALDGFTLECLEAPTNSKTRIKGLRRLASRETELEEQFWRQTSKELAKDKIRRHPCYEALRRAQIFVSFDLSDPNVSYERLVEISRDLDRLEQRRNAVPRQIYHGPSVHRGRHVRRRRARQLT